MIIDKPKSLPSCLFLLLNFIILSFFLGKMEVFSSFPFSLIVNAAFFGVCAFFIYDKVQATGRINYGGWPNFFLSLYLFFSLFNSVFKGVGGGVILYQFIIELKPLLIYLAVVNARNLSFRSTKIFKAALVVGVFSLLLFCLRVAAPSFYDVIFSAGGHGANFHTYDGGEGLWRAVGIFWHPGQLSFYCLCVLGLVFLYSRESGYFYNERKKTLILSATLFFMLAVSLRRADLMTLPVATYGAIWLTRKNRAKQLFSIFIFLFLVSVFFVSIDDYIGRAVEHYSFFNPKDSVSPRVVYTYKAVEIANNNFPFGSGLGTFASHGSAAFGSDLEEAVGMRGYWWYEAGQAGYDAFWAHVVAESGYLGTVLYVAFLFSLLLKVALSDLSLPLKKLRVFAVLVLIASTLTSSAIFSIYYLTAIFLIFCITENSVSSRSSDVSATT